MGVEELEFDEIVVLSGSATLQEYLAARERSASRGVRSTLLGVAVPCAGKWRDLIIPKSLRS